MEGFELLAGGVTRKVRVNTDWVRGYEQGDDEGETGPWRVIEGDKTTYCDEVVFTQLPKAVSGEVKVPGDPNGCNPDGYTDRHAHLETDGDLYVKKSKRQDY